MVAESLKTTAWLFLLLMETAIEALMISFSGLGSRSRLGNHLFQYAFLRTTSKRIGVKFYCPTWAGDYFFQLEDNEERSDAMHGIIFDYKEPYYNTGFNKDALEIQDRTNIQGYFQTEKYLDRYSVLTWYKFKKEKISSIRDRYSQVDFKNSTGLSIRLGDFITVYKDQFYIPRLSYYENALDCVLRKKHVIIFSDEIEIAKDIFNNFFEDKKLHVIYANDYEPYEGLYLQSRCRDFICSPSTYSWWGAWLNTFPDKIIVAPKEGAFRPGGPVINNEFWPDNWLRITALKPFVDHYEAVKIKILTRRVLSKFRRLIKL